MWRCWPLLTLAACGRLDFSPVGAATGDDGTGDAGGDGATPGDAGPQMMTFGDTGGSAIGATTRDASITAVGGSTTWNYGASAIITVSSAFRFTGLLRFDLSALPANAIIDSATLELTNTFANADTAADGYELLEDWDEGMADGAPGTCNWNTRMAPSTAWSGAGATGASRASTPMFSLPPPSGVGRISTPIPPSTITGWVTMPSSNHGIELYGTSGLNALNYASHESATAADRPALIVAYELPAP